MHRAAKGTTGEQHRTSGRRLMHGAPQHSRRCADLAPRLRTGHRLPHNPTFPTYSLSGYKSEKSDSPVTECRTFRRAEWAGGRGERAGEAVAVLIGGVIVRL
ncbi:hypothetical protein GCM10018962_30780 [Dactylosporangium matsuzakiense]|uniref:Uncharacterized protein n=1 Tax=Dactylosporangium matsuzakiense TaxID=53360 RepID=A0A9W6KLZ1_9ACTN|nr:hypothetical protein GCM10017581_043420 [Dactylosporangium matsuzakiense]